MYDLAAMAQTVGNIQYRLLLFLFRSFLKFQLIPMHAILIVYDSCAVSTPSNWMFIDTHTYIPTYLHIHKHTQMSLSPAKIENELMHIQI